MPQFQQILPPLEKLVMKSVLRRSSLALILGAFAVAAIAHHGWSGYDSKLVPLEGTIESSSYGNPHGSITLKTADATWNVVLAPPGRMESRGLTREMLQLAKPDAIVMHPGPINRGVEIDSGVADGTHSVIMPQVTFGIAVRMAVMAILAGNA